MPKKNRKRRLAQLDFTGQDIMAIAFLVILEDSRTAHEDLKLLMKQVRRLNRKRNRRRWRRLATALEGRLGLDGLSEMGEMESLRLQMAMDRLSKMMSTLSN